MENLKSLYFKSQRELKALYFKGDLTEFLALEKQLQSQGFYINKYEEVTGFNFLQMVLSQGDFGVFIENLELTEYIEQQSSIDSSLAAIFTVLWNMEDHVDHWHKKYGQPYLDEIFSSVKHNLGKLDQSKLNDLLMKAALHNPVLAELIREFDLKEFVAIQGLDFLNDQNYKGFKNLLTVIFNNPKGHVFKTIGSIVQNGNIAHLSFLYAVKQVCPEVSDDKLLNVPAHTGDFATVKPFLPMLSEILRHLSLERRFNFMVKALLDTTGNYHSTFQETLDMYNFMKTKNISHQIDFSDIKNFLDLHNAVSKHLTNIEQDNQSLPSNFANLHNKIFNEYLMKIPQENKDLVEVGKSMNICVGAGVYLSKILMRKCDIVFLYKGNNPQICIELSLAGDIVQIKGPNNSQIQDETMLQQLKKLFNQ